MITADEVPLHVARVVIWHNILFEFYTILVNSLIQNMSEIEAQNIRRIYVYSSGIPVDSGHNKWRNGKNWTGT